MKDVSSIPYHILRAMGKGDDAVWLTCTLDISKLQAISRHHEALLDALILLGEAEPSSMALSNGASGAWVSAVTGLLQQLMAIVPYEEMWPVPEGLQNYLALMTRASGVTVTSLEDLTTDQSIWRGLLHRALAAGNRGNSTYKFPLMLRRMKADPAMGVDIPWLAMGNMAKATHKAYLDIIMPKFLMLALLSGLAESTALRGRDVAVMVGENMIPHWTFPIRGCDNEELERTNYVHSGHGPGKLLGVCVPPGDISSSSPQGPAQESNKKGTLKHMNLLVAVDGLTPQGTMDELVVKTEPLLCKDMRVETANQLLLHNQGLELLSMRLTIMPTPLSSITEGIENTPRPPEGEDLAAFFSQQACI